MLTPFGKFTRKLRIDNGELLKNMSDKLGVTSAYLSAVETGKRNVPLEWQESLSELYSLRAEDIHDLKVAIEYSQLSIKIDLKKFNTTDKHTVIAFAQLFRELNDEERSKIMSILQGKNRGNIGS